MVDYPQIVGDSAEHVLSSATYDADSFARFSVGNQPLVTGVSMLLAVERSFTEQTQAFLQINAEEELRGANGEGPHFVLATKFFRQVVAPQKVHSTAIQPFLEDASGEANPRALISFMASVEAWSVKAMPIIGQAMRELGAVDMTYVEVHMHVDGGDDGHSAQFMDALDRERITEEELRRGTNLFVNLFGAIFRKSN